VVFEGFFNKNAPHESKHAFPCYKSPFLKQLQAVSLFFFGLRKKMGQGKKKEHVCALLSITVKDD
jgi:hypothetical protein